MNSDDQKPTSVSFGGDVLDKMVIAVEKVQKRQRSIVSALSEANIPFGLFGSNATFVWIESIDESAVRFYRNIDLLIQRENSGLVKTVLMQLNLIPEEHVDHILFRTDDNQRDRWSDHAFFAREQLLKCDVIIPGLESVVNLNGIPVVGIAELVTFQLARKHRDDLVDLRDMIEVGLIDQSWTAKLLPELAARLQEILDTPDG